MKQPHTEGAVDHTDGEQDTGNHRAPDANPPTPGGTRIGADNVESATDTGPSVDTDIATGLQANLDESISVNGPGEQQVGKDEPW